MKSFKDFLLRDVSWIKIGGVAREFIDVESSDEFVEVVSGFKKEGRRFEVLGWGANTLISDGGLDCCVVRNRSSFVEIGGSGEVKGDFGRVENFESDGASRHKFFQETGVSSGYNSDDLDYDESGRDVVLVKVGAGVSLPYLINFLIGKGVTGLQLFSGIPGSVGGSVFNNIHGGSRLLSEFVFGVDVVDGCGNLLSLSREELLLGYNESRFQRNGEVVVSVTFSLRLGDKERARFVAVEWARRKSSQPRNSLGSTFHNLEADVQARLGLPTPSVAYLIEHRLGLSGFRVGGIMVPEKRPEGEVQVNKNILTNVGNGTASDYLAVMRKIWTEAYERFGVRLRSEVFFKGFEREEIGIFSGEDC